eukprot:Opistho-2@91272
MPAMPLSAARTVALYIFALTFVLCAGVCAGELACTNGANRKDMHHYYNFLVRRGADGEHIDSYESEKIGVGLEPGTPDSQSMRLPATLRVAANYSSAPFSFVYGTVPLSDGSTVVGIKRKTQGDDFFYEVIQSRRDGAEGVAEKRILNVPLFRGNDTRIGASISGAYIGSGGSSPGAILGFPQSFVFAIERASTLHPNAALLSVAIYDNTTDSVGAEVTWPSFSLTEPVFFLNGTIARFNVYNQSLVEAATTDEIQAPYSLFTSPYDGSLYFVVRFYGSRAIHVFCYNAPTSDVSTFPSFRWRSLIFPDVVSTVVLTSSILSTLDFDPDTSDVYATVKFPDVSPLPSPLVEGFLSYAAPGYVPNNATTPRAGHIVLRLSRVSGVVNSVSWPPEIDGEVVAIDGAAIGGGEFVLLSSMLNSKGENALLMRRLSFGTAADKASLQATLMGTCELNIITRAAQTTCNFVSSHTSGWAIAKVGANMAGPLSGKLVIGGAVGFISDPSGLDVDGGYAFLAYVDVEGLATGQASRVVRVQAFGIASAANSVDSISVYRDPESGEGVVYASATVDRRRLASGNWTQHSLVVQTLPAGDVWITCDASAFPSGADGWANCYIPTTSESTGTCLEYCLQAVCGQESDKIDNGIRTSVILGVALGMSIGGVVVAAALVITWRKRKRRLAEQSQHHDIVKGDSGSITADHAETDPLLA